MFAKALTTAAILAHALQSPSMPCDGASGNHIRYGTLARIWLDKGAPVLGMATPGEQKPIAIFLSGAAARFKSRIGSVLYFYGSEIDGKDWCVLQIHDTTQISGSRPEAIRRLELKAGSEAPGHDQNRHVRKPLTLDMGIARAAPMPSIICSETRS